MKVSVELHMLPVKAGDATLILETDTDTDRGYPYAVLIDTGLDAEEAHTYIQNFGVRHLDLVILSHPDADHIGGFLAIMRDPSIKISKLWCFDLSFLREFVRTGKIPEPESDTHRITYGGVLYDLITQGDILKQAAINGVSAYQVSEGHRLNVGSLHIEVLYPWDGFYNQLRSPRSLKRLLANKWPEDWERASRTTNDRERRCRPSARELSAPEEQKFLRELLEKHGFPEQSSTIIGSVPPDSKEDEAEESDEESETVSLPTIGTLYNNLSIVLKIHRLGGMAAPTMLFPGDLSDWTYLVARRWHDLEATIFKYPHHGSADVGLSERALFDRSFVPGRCPSGPWCSYDCYREHYYWWREVLLAAQSDQAMLFSKMIQPSHTLVFPYPKYHLPTTSSLRSMTGRLHANRVSTALKDLGSKDNDPTPCILEVGLEESQIT